MPLTIMRRIRVIPILLLSNSGLVKTVRFKKPTYIGDPINAVKIFNEKMVDELVILDIDKTRQEQSPDFDHIRAIVSEAFMPLAYGGGIHSLDEIKKVIDCGVEKVVINSAAWHNATMIEQGAKIFGSQSMVASVDVRKDFFGREGAYVENGKTRVKYTLIEYITRLQDHGVGEIMLTSIDREGTFSGYDENLIAKVSGYCRVPLVANGGSRGPEDFLGAIKAGASAVAAGSRFVYSGKERGILINYPSQAELREKIFGRL